MEKANTPEWLEAAEGLINLAKDNADFLLEQMLKTDSDEQFRLCISGLELAWAIMHNDDAPEHTKSYLHEKMCKIWLDISRISKSARGGEE
jgi:hypothetical protein